MSKKKTEKQEVVYIVQANVTLSTGKRYKAGHKFSKDDLEKIDFDALREMKAIATIAEIEKAEKLADGITLESMKEAIEELAPATALSTDEEDVTTIEV